MVLQTFEDLIQPARATDDHNKRVELYKQRSGDARSGSGTDHRSLHRV
ncbi:dipeptide ABC transporter, substrate-binding protein [Escherichia coli]|nr:dipeptide ABC transporter, substrate-binding protein [Escherichia coli]